MVVATGPRVFLAGHGKTVPADVTVAVDDEMRVWTRGADGRFHWDGRHHLTPAELLSRTDLVEVPQ